SCRKFIFFVIGPDSLIVPCQRVVGLDLQAASYNQAVIVNQARSGGGQTPVGLLSGKFGAYRLCGRYCSTEQSKASLECGLEGDGTDCDELDHSELRWSRVELWWSSGGALELGAAVRSQRYVSRADRIYKPCELDKTTVPLSPFLANFSRLARLFSWPA
ncbi:hypothetical protein C8R45DRAFT_1015440, partial [Mycena sanguinolenta]